VLRDYALVPGTLIPGRAAALRVVAWREVSLLFTTGEIFNATDSIPATADHFSHGTGRPRRGLRRRGFEPHSAKAVSRQKYPWPITTDRVRSAGGISGSGMVDLQSKEPAACATQLSF
jgi:hypothetical protein